MSSHDARRNLKQSNLPILPLIVFAHHVIHPYLQMQQ